MSGEIEIGPLKRKRDKAVAAHELSEILRNIRSVDSSEAVGAAVHEFRHAVKDHKPGNYVVPREHNMRMLAAYRPLGNRSRTEMMKIVQGPKEDMRGGDLQIAEALDDPMGIKRFIEWVKERFGRGDYWGFRWQKYYPKRQK